MVEESSPPQVCVCVMDRALICCVAATRDAELHLARAMQQSLGLETPGPNRRATSGETDLIWQEPGRWLLRAPSSFATKAIAALGALGALGAHDDLLISDFSHGLVLFEVSGPRCRDMLAKCIPLDLDPRVFGLDHTAATRAHHIDVWLWRRAENVYEIACELSYARDLRHHLIDAGREFGVIFLNGDESSPGIGSPPS